MNKYSNLIQDYVERYAFGFPALNAVIQAAIKDNQERIHTAPENSCVYTTIGKSNDEIETVICVRGFEDEKGQALQVVGINWLGTDERVKEFLESEDSIGFSHIYGENSEGWELTTYAGDSTISERIISILKRHFGYADDDRISCCTYYL